MPDFLKARRLDKVRYEIRGALHQIAHQLENAGEHILKLNIGNPAAFGFKTPKHIIEAIHTCLENLEGYTDSKGLLAARQAILAYYQKQGFKDVDIEHIFIGNGVSELIVMGIQAFLNFGDEVLIPMPDYPLWTAAVHLADAKAVHYRCDEMADWFPDVNDIRRKISPRTRALVIINPNNPTGAVYSKEVLLELAQVAREHNLLIFADEIYEQIIFDEMQHQPIARLAPDLLTVTMGGLSKAYFASGFRQGWMLLTGPIQKKAHTYLEGLNLLASLRLCANVPMQAGIVAALQAPRAITPFLQPGGRLLVQRDLTHQLLQDIPGISCVKQKGALYCFPKIDTKHFHIHSDARFVLDFLQKEKVLLVHGTGLNWDQADHFRIVTLANVEDLYTALSRLKNFLIDYQQNN